MGNRTAPAILLANWTTLRPPLSSRRCDSSSNSSFASWSNSPTKSCSRKSRMGGRRFSACKCGRAMWDESLAETGKQFVRSGHCWRARPRVTVRKRPWRSWNRAVPDAGFCPECLRSARATAGIFDLTIDLDRDLAVGADPAAIHSRGIKRQRKVSILVECDQTALTPELLRPA